MQQNNDILDILQEELHVFLSFSGWRFEYWLIRSFHFSSYDCIARKILAMGAVM